MLSGTVTVVLLKRLVRTEKITYMSESSKPHHMTELILLIQTLTVTQSPKLRVT